MKRMMLGIMFMMLLLPAVNAQQTATNDPGITPDSFLWGLDKALDTLSLLLTFDKGEKAKKGLEIAQERLLEVQAMIRENKMDAAERAEAAHGKTLSEVKRNIETLKEDNSTEEMQKIISIEKGLETHDQEVEQTFGELKIKIDIKGEVTEQQKELIGSILNSLKGQTGEVEIMIKNKKNEIKVKMRRETGKPEEEIESEIRDMEDEQGIEKDEKALEAIRDAKKELGKFLQEAADKNMTAPQDLLDRFGSLLEEARAHFEQGNFTEAKTLAKHAERVLDRENDEESREEKEIEVETEEGEAKIGIRIKGEKLKFRMNTTDSDAIISEISDKTGLSKDEIRSIMKLKDEREQDDERDDDGEWIVGRGRTKEQPEERSRKESGEGKMHEREREDGAAAGDERADVND